MCIICSHYVPNQLVKFFLKNFKNRNKESKIKCIFWDVFHQLEIIYPWNVKIVFPFQRKRNYSAKGSFVQHTSKSRFLIIYIRSPVYGFLYQSLSTKSTVSQYSWIFPQAEESLCHYSCICFTPLKVKNSKNLWRKDFINKIAMSNEGERRISFSSISVEKRKPDWMISQGNFTPKYFE